MALAVVGTERRRPGTLLDRQWVRDGLDDPERVMVRELSPCQTEECCEALASRTPQRRDGEPFKEGSIGRRFDADGNGTIDHTEARSAFQAHSNGDLTLQAAGEV